MPQDFEPAVAEGAQGTSPNSEIVGSSTTGSSAGAALRATALLGRMTEESKHCGHSPMHRLFGEPELAEDGAHVLLDS